MKQLLTAPLAALLLTLILTACGGAPAQPAAAWPAEPPSSSAGDPQTSEASQAAPVPPSPDSPAPEATPAPALESGSPETALPAAGPASSPDAGPGDGQSQAQAVGLCEVYVACDHLGSVEELLDADVELFEGDTVWDLLARSGDEHHLSAIKTGSGDSLRVKAIGGVWEEAHGEDSCWVYSVNGWYPDEGCGVYTPKDGDVIRWEYLNPGRDTDD